MHPIQIPKSGIPCDRCNIKMFAGSTPNGADCVSCPLCDDVFYIGEDELDIDIDSYFCKKCGILFNLGCIHALNGCTSDIYHAELVHSYQIDGIETIGMPVFDSLEELTKLFPNMSLKFVCTCTDETRRCPEGSYDYNKYYNITNDVCSNECTS